MFRKKWERVAAPSTSFPWRHVATFLCKNAGEYCDMTLRKGSSIGRNLLPFFSKNLLFFSIFIDLLSFNLFSFLIFFDFLISCMSILILSCNLDTLPYFYYHSPLLQSLIPSPQIAVQVGSSKILGKL